MERRPQDDYWGRLLGPNALPFESGQRSERKKNPIQGKKLGIIWGRGSRAEENLKRSSLLEVKKSATPRKEGGEDEGVIAGLIQNACVLGGCLGKTRKRGRRGFRIQAREWGTGRGKNEIYLSNVRFGALRYILKLDELLRPVDNALVHEGEIYGQRRRAGKQRGG